MSILIQFQKQFRSHRFKSEQKSSEMIEIPNHKFTYLFQKKKTQLKVKVGKEAELKTALGKVLSDPNAFGQEYIGIIVLNNVFFDNCFLDNYLFNVFWLIFFLHKKKLFC